jgi:hypothetical protein
MRKIFWFNLVIVLLSIITSLVTLFVWITQSYNFRLSILHDLYNTLDNSGIGMRAILLFMISLGSGFAIFRFRNYANSSRSGMWGIISAVIGLFISLLVFYAFSCCESPVAFNFGFPLSWLHAISKESNRLPVPEFQYLIQNLGYMVQWHIDVYSLWVDLFFWYCAGFTFYVLIVREPLTWKLKRISPICS